MNSSKLVFEQEKNEKAAKREIKKVFYCLNVP